MAALLCLGCSSVALAGTTLDAYGGALSLQCGPNSKAVTSPITAVTRSSGIVTLTFASPSPFIVGDVLAVSGTTADGGSFNTPAGQLFTVTVVPNNTQISYRQAGNNVNPTSSAGSGQLARFYAGKVGSRWWLCTPLSNAMWMNGVSLAEHNGSKDYQNIINTDVVVGKYTTGVTTSGVDNWAYQTGLRLKAWGFNTVAEYGDVHLFPTTVDPLWNTSDDTIPSAARLPFFVEANPIIYSAYNQNNYAAGPVKNELGLYKKSLYNGAMRGMADVFDPNFSKWFAGDLAKGQIHSEMTGPHREYLIAFVGDESDTTGGFRLGSDFQPVAGGGTSDPNTAILLTGNGVQDPQWGWMILVSSPIQTATGQGNTPKGVSPHDIVYRDTQVHSKGELSRWLQQKTDRGPGYASIAALDTAWQSNYDSFGSDAKSHTQTCATGNGTAGPYTCTLTSVPVTPLTVQVKVGGRLTAGDDGSGPEARPATGAGNFRTSTGRQPIGSITYSSGAVSITFSAPVSSGTSIAVVYQTNGWGGGHGLLDEDGTCPSRKSGQACWVPSMPYWTAASSENQLEKDLDGFLYHFAKTYFGLMKSDIAAVDPGVLYMPVDPLGGYACPPRREILEAAALYCGILPVGAIPANDPTGIVPDEQARIDFVAEYAGDLPWMDINFMIAQADSYFPATQYPVTSTLSFSTQLARGEYYDIKTGVELTTSVSPGCNCAFSGTYPIVGQNFWSLYDDPSEKTNWGLVTLRDDPYDGKASTPNQGTDQWGYPTGCQGPNALPGPTTPCEQGSYGDTIDSMTGANALWLGYAVP